MFEFEKANFLTPTTVWQPGERTQWNAKNGTIHPLHTAQNVLKSQHLEVSTF